MKCTDFGVSCNYDVKTPDLQICFDGTTTIKAPQKPPYSTNQTLVSRTEVPNSLYYPPIVSDGESSMQLDSQSLERLARFHKRTVLSIGSKRTAHLFQNLTIPLACSVRPPSLSAPPNPPPH
jgi:hypothetical protein